MKLQHVLIGASVALVLSVALAGGCSRKSRPGEYYNPARAYSIIPPAGWEQQPGRGATDVMFACPVGQHSENFRENISVGTETLSKAMSLDDYMQSGPDKEFRRLEGFRYVSVTDVDLGNVKAKRAVFTCSFHDASLQTVVYVAVKGDRGYILACASTPENFSMFERTFDECAWTFRVE